MTANMLFINALRECLGLAPIKISRNKKTTGIPYHVRRKLGICIVSGCKNKSLLDKCRCEMHNKRHLIRAQERRKAA